MPLIEECYANTFGPHQERFNIDSHYPIIIIDDTFAHIDKDGMFCKRMGKYCNDFYAVSVGSTKNIRSKIIEAKRAIKNALLPLDQVMINYCFLACYSGFGGVIADEAFEYLSSIECDASFSDSYFVSVIIVVESSIANDDQGLVGFLQGIAQKSNKFNLFVFTYDMGQNSSIESIAEPLFDSIIASIILRSNGTLRGIALENEADARRKITKYLRDIPITGLMSKPKFKWQSMCASFFDKKYDFVAQVLRLVFSNVTMLTPSIVAEEAEKIDISHINIQNLKPLLMHTFYAIPTVTKYKPKPFRSFSFYDVCLAMFGRENYQVAEISFKTTFASHAGTSSHESEYVGKAKELVLRASQYGHSRIGLANAIASGIDMFIDAMKKEEVVAENDYRSFIHKQFDKGQFEFDDVLEGYARRFLIREELSSKRDYWEALKTRLNPVLASISDEALPHVGEFNKNRDAINSFVCKYNFNIPVMEFEGYTINMALASHKNTDFIEKVRRMYEIYSESAEQGGVSPRWGFVFAYEGHPAVALKTNMASINFGSYQIIFSQAFGEYWIFR